MIKSIRIEVGSTVLNLKIEDALVLKDELNKMFSPVATNHPSTSLWPITSVGDMDTMTIPCTTTANATLGPLDQYAAYSTNSTKADPDETWNPAG